MTCDCKVGAGYNRLKLAEVLMEDDDREAICPECGEPVAEEDDLCKDCAERMVALSEMPGNMDLTKRVEAMNQLWWIMNGGKE